MEEFDDCINEIDVPQHYDDNEWEQYQSVAAAFKHYRTHTLKRINKRLQYILTLPESHQRRLTSYSGHLTKFREYVEVNEALLDLVVKDGSNIFQNQAPAAPPTNNWGNEGASGDIEPPLLQVNRVETTLRQLVRDWSKEGSAEREECYRPILDELRLEFPPEIGDTRKVRVLVPGAGLGRLAYEVARAGYSSQGNEISMFMLIASNFILNFCAEKERHVVYPWLTHFNNNLTCEHQALPVRIPDALLSDLPHPEDFAMVAGDFPNAYTEHNRWHSVATCFFIDCAPNVIVFVEQIFNILRPGGVWINLGPLLYHYSDMAEVDSIEPPYDVLMDIIKDVGFIVEKERTGVRTGYTTNVNSMERRGYRSALFVCRKPVGAATQPPRGVAHAPYVPRNGPPLPADRRDRAAGGST